MFLRQSTASQEILLGPFLDDTDGKTAETGLTIANTDIKIWKSGGTTESNKNSGGATHIASGRYYAVLDATDCDTVGLLEVSVSVSGALPVRRQFYVLEEAVYDSLFAGSAAGYQVPIWSSASATVNLSGTTIKTATDVETDTQDIQSRLPAALVSGRIDSSVGAMASNVITAAAFATDAVDEIVDGVWDEVLTGATHNVASSAGRRLRQLASVIVRAGTAQGSGTGNNQIQLDAGASATNGEYDPGLIFIETGTGAGQARLILQYNGSTKVATVDRDWRINPDNTSEFVILADAGRESVNEGLAQAATTTTITLNTSASSTDDAYNGQLVFIRSGTGQDQIALVEDYVGSTKVATIRTRSSTGQWAIVPDTTSAYVMIPNLTWTISEIQSGLATTTQLTTVESKIDTIDNFVDTEVSAIKAKTDQLSFTVANQVDANALTGGGGGGGSIVVTPVVAQTPVRAVATTITTFKGDRSAITVGVFDELDPVDLSALGALEVCIQTKAGTDLQLISAANITISGTDSNYFSFSPNATAVGTVGRFMWSLRVASSSSKRVITYGAFVVEDAALAD